MREEWPGPCLLGGRMATSMRIFGQMEHQGHEQVVFVRDSGAGLTAIIAIHSTVLGPAVSISL